MKQLYFIPKINLGLLFLTYPLDYLWRIYSRFKTSLNDALNLGCSPAYICSFKNAPRRNRGIEERFLFCVLPLTCCFNFSVSSRQVGCHLVNSWQLLVVLAEILAVDFFFNECSQCFDKTQLSIPREITEFLELFSDQLFPERNHIFLSLSGILSFCSQRSQLIAYWL